MKQLVALFLFCLVFGCKKDADTNNGISNQKEALYREVKKAEMSTIRNNICASYKIEFIDLYPILESIASDRFEKSILVDTLKKHGFILRNGSRGNWMYGPRIVNYTLISNNCQCQVDKLYYSTEIINRYRVTERISCKIE